MGETVGPVYRLSADVGHRDDVVTADVKHGTGGGDDTVDGDGIVRQGALEVGGVEATVPGQDLPDGDELTRVVGAVEHERDQWLHAVEAGNLGARAVGILAHADAHVEPSVAVNEVVAALAFDDVAAIATQDDVAAAKRGHTGTEEILQPVDQGDIGEDAPPGGDGGDDVGGLIIADQEVGEGRAR